MAFSTPILLLIFNRPETTKIVFERIRSIKPLRLYVAADGPRIDKNGERQACETTRQIVLEGVDWECEVKTLLRDNNLGCGKSVSGAITWFFENVEEGIILEDDCLPSISFFKYAEHCLSKYRFHNEIMHVGGNNFISNLDLDYKYSYFFSAYNHIWGWATWRRAWMLYEYDLNKIDQPKLEKALSHYFSSSIKKGWIKLFNEIKLNPIDTWDYQWSFCIWLNKGLCVYPNVNLVSNIGFGPQATHTFDITNKFSNLPHQEIETISSPYTIKRNKRADIVSSESAFGFKNNLQISILIKCTYGKITPLWKRIKAFI